MENKRKSHRKKLQIVTYIRKRREDNRYYLMEFVSQDLSKSGVFITTEDLTIFGLGEDVDILVTEGKERYYEGKARVVRSARVFSETGEPDESGFGLMFLQPDPQFQEMLDRTVKDEEPVEPEEV
ncbi:MAG: PilZ domain-containing protein [Spirochaetia bacterium]